MQSGNSKKIQDILFLLPIHGNNGMFNHVESRLATTHSFADSTSKFAYDFGPKRITECKRIPYRLYNFIMHALSFIIETIQANQLS